MSKIIVLDAGHGGTDPGACGNGLKEAQITLSVCKLMQPELERHGLTVKFTRTSDTYLSLSDRANIANKLGATLFISDHCNSATSSSATGVEVFTHPTSDAKNDKLSMDVSASIANALGIRDRGAKEENFAVLRETKMPSILIENAFISNVGDAKLLSTKQQVIADAVTKEVLKYLGITCNGHTTIPPTTNNSVFYRVVVGSYLDKAKASSVEAKLKAEGFGSFLDAFVKDGQTFFRVIAGSYSIRSNAENTMKQLTDKGYVGVFIATYSGNTQTPAPTVPVTPPTPQPTKKYLNLPKSATEWNVYPTNKQPVKGNECGKLKPSKFGGLSYEILATPQSNVYTIQTSNFGKVNIYGASSTGATITTSPKY